MKLFFTTITIALLSYSGLFAEEDKLQASIDQRIDRELNQAIIIGVLNASGEIYISSGSFTEGDERSVDEYTIFEIGGISKLFTATATSDLVIKRKLLWKTPIKALLPILSHGEGWSEAGINIHQLATHSSGLPAQPVNLTSPNPQDPYLNYNEEQLYQGLSQTAITFKPGNFYRHSDLGYALLGQILVRREGKDYETIISERVTAPLGMVNTSINLNPQQQLRLAPGHQGLSEVPSTNYNALEAAGGLRSTAYDLMRFLKAQMGILRTSKSRAISVTQAQLMPTGAEQTMVGYGWQISQVDGETLYWHNGNTRGYSAFIGFNHSDHTAVVVLTNTNQNLDNIGFHVLSPSEFPLQELPRLARIKSEDLERYVGQYQITPQASLTVSKAGQRLYAQFSNMPRYRIYPLSKSRFVFATGDISLKFKSTGKRKKVNTVSIQEKLKSYTGNRIM